MTNTEKTAFRVACETPKRKRTKEQTAMLRAYCAKHGQASISVPTLKVKGPKFRQVRP